MTLVVVVVVAIVFLASVSLKDKTWPRKRFKYRGSTLLLSGYAAVLLLAVLISFMLPDMEDTKAEGLNDHEVQTQSVKMEQLLRAGKITEVPEEYLKKQWVFRYKEKQVTLHDPSDYGTMTVYVSKNAENKKVRVSYFQSPSSIAGQNISDVPIPKVDLAGKILDVHYPESINQQYSLFQQEFPFKQFNGNDQSSFSTSSSFGLSILYVEVPEDVKVDTNSSSVNIIN